MNHPHHHQSIDRMPIDSSLYAVGRIRGPNITTKYPRSQHTMSLRGDNEIDSLLSIMGGADKDETCSFAEGYAPSKTASTEKSKKRKKSKKRRRDKETSLRTSYLKSRLDLSSFHWPTSNDGRRLLSLGSGLAHECTRYTASKVNADADTNYGSAYCIKCGRSSSTHELCLSLNSQQTKDVENTPYMPLATMIVAARNARCVMGEYHVAINASTSKNNFLSPANSVQSTSKLISNRLDLFLGRVLAELRQMQANWKIGIFSDDLILLKEKVQSMIEAITDYKKTISVAESHINVINQRLKAISFCDMLYYRCYYSSIIFCSSNIDSGVNIDLIALIPHPPTYFSCPGLAWDILESGSKALGIFLGVSKDNNNHRFACSQLDENMSKILLDNWGLSSKLDVRDASAEHNPLLSLWQSRFAETVRHIWATGYCHAVSCGVISGRMSSSSNNKVRTAKDINELPHNETIAISKSVSLWRDSIRDYPANFYAYACPTSSCLEVISNNLQSETQSAVEAGAGTGYWSALMNKNKPVLFPYDIAPPSHEMSNSYHGLIPTFTDVKLAHSFGQFNGAIQQSASTLFLCYPPPESDMASSCLSTHMQNGGHNLIHIGEWHGLTGNAAFEKLLTENFYCEQSELLPLWGTDATYVTIWKRKLIGQQKSGKRLYSPSFGFCSCQPCNNFATKRCRLARCLQYCSDACFQKHNSSRRAYLALHMVHLPLDQDLEFSCDLHFVDLKLEEVQEKKKKRRKR